MTNCCKFEFKFICLMLRCHSSEMNCLCLRKWLRKIHIIYHIFGTNTKNPLSPEVLFSFFISSKSIFPICPDLLFEKCGKGSWRWIFFCRGCFEAGLVAQLLFTQTASRLRAGAKLFHLIHPLGIINVHPNSGAT